MSDDHRIDPEIDDDAHLGTDDAAPAAEPTQRALVSVGAPNNLFCRLGFHRARPSNLWNDGHYFSSCQRCGTMLIRKPEGSWKPIPPSMRVVWRRRTDDDIVWPTHIL